jgi:mRNA interferase RelE/StbE
LYIVEYLAEASKELALLDKPIQRIIKEKIDTLAANPDILKNNIKALKGEHGGKYRLRVGDYRIIYRLQNEVVTITIIRIGHRKEVY